MFARFLRKKQVRASPLSAYGISSYLSSGAPISGAVKTIPQDFIVREIDAAGNAAHYNRPDPSIPVPVAAEETTSAGIDVNDAASQMTSALGADTALAVATMANKFLKLPEQVSAGITRRFRPLLASRPEPLDIEPPLRPWAVSLPLPADKPGRLAIHSAIRDALNGILATYTTDTSIVAVPQRASAPTRRPSARSRLVLYKVDTSAPSALYRASRAISTAAGRNVSAQQLTVFGTKDHHAVTAQYVVANGCTAADVKSAAALLEHENAPVRISYCGQADDKAHLGGHSGNSFTLTLRGLRAPGLRPRTRAARLLAARASAIARIGFPNYFGTQRFGNWSVGTHEVGRAIAKADWGTAAELFVKSYSGAATGAGRAVVEKFLADWDPAAAAVTGDFSTDTGAGADGSVPLILTTFFNALARAAPPRTSTGPALRALGDPHRVALQSLPKQSLSLYIHAYQSLLFNAALAARLATDATGRALPGDIVLMSRSDNGPSDQASTQAGTPHVVTEAEAQDGTWGLADVVMPIFVAGGHVPAAFWETPTGKAMSEILSNDGINREAGLLGRIGRDGVPMPAARGNLRAFGLDPGLWRPAMQRPLDGWPLRVSLVGERMPVHLPKITGLSKLPSARQLLTREGLRRAHAKLVRAGPVRPLVATETRPLDAGIRRRTLLFDSETGRTTVDVPRGKLSAVVEVALPSSTYATVFLRELLHSVDEDCRRSDL